MKAAAERYGLEARRGMVCFPFHADRTPSMKLNEDITSTASGAGRTAT